MTKYNTSKNDEYLLNKNKLGAQTSQELEAGEKLAFSIRALKIELEEYEITSFSKKSFQDLHFYLFQDVYSFAGQFRDVQLMKGNTRFCQAQYLEGSADELFKQLEDEGKWETLERAADRMAYFKAEMNMLHPFREGNGRTIRIFLQKYAASKGYIWDYDDMERDEYLKAMILSVTDTNPLKKIFLKTLKQNNY